MAINNDKVIVSVTNRDNSLVGYWIPELNLKRTFNANETKKLDAEELRALAWTKGGRAVIKNHLIIDSKELIAELLGEVEPEYFYTDKDIENLLLHGSEDQLRDALDFGYDGTTETIKDKAVELKLNDVRKRDIILEKTDFNVTNAISINEESEKAVAETKVRRAAPLNSDDTPAAEAPARRAASPYKLVTKNDN